MKRSLRGRSGFERLGRLDVDNLGLPARQARDLLLEHTWQRVAGEAVARRARAVRVQRGVLEIEVTESAWAKNLKPLLPRLIGRLARVAPELGVKKFRLRLEGESVLPPGSPVPALEEDAGHEKATAPPKTEAGPASAPEEQGTQPGRLLDLAQRYLERTNAVPDRRDENRR